MQLDVSVESLGGCVFVMPKGAVDLSTSDAVKDVCNGLLATGCVYLVLDLNRTTFLDSMALGMFLGVRRRLVERGGSFSLVGADERLMKVFAITGLTEVFTFHQSRAAAVEAAQWLPKPDDPPTTD